VTTIFIIVLTMQIVASTLNYNHHNYDAFMQLCCMIILYHKHIQNLHTVNCICILYY